MIINGRQGPQQRQPFRKPMPAQAAPPPNLLAGGAAPAPGAPGMQRPQPPRQLSFNTPMGAGGGMPAMNTPYGGGMSSGGGSAGAPQGVVGGQRIHSPILNMPPGSRGIRGGNFGATISNGNETGMMGSPDMRGGMGQGVVAGQGGAPQQGMGGGYAQALQDSQDRANAANEERYQQMLGINQQGGQAQLQDLNDSYSKILGMPGQQKTEQMNYLNAGMADLQKRNEQGTAGALAMNQQNQQGLQNSIGQARGQEMGYLNQAYGGLMDMAGQQKKEQMGFAQNAYSGLMGMAQGNQNQQMGFLGQQDARSQGILDNFSNSEISREEQRKKNMLGSLTQQMMDRGLSSTTGDLPHQRAIEDESARRIAEIGDRRAGRELGVADAYAGRGLGVLGQTGSQQLGVGQNYANAGMGTLANAGQNQLGIGQSGAQAGYGAMAGLNRFGLGAQQSAGQAGLDIYQGGSRTGINLGQGGMNQGLGIMGDAGRQEIGLASQYAGGRQNLMGEGRRERIGIIGDKTDAFDANPYLQLLAQGGGQSGGGGPATYNGGMGQQGHRAGRGGNAPSPFGDPFGLGGGGGGSFYDSLMGGGDYGSGGDPNQRQYTQDLSGGVGEIFDPLNPYADDFQPPVYPRRR